MCKNNVIHHETFSSLSTYMVLITLYNNHNLRGGGVPAICFGSFLYAKLCNFSALLNKLSCKY